MGEKYAWASPDAVGHLTMPQLLMYLKTDKQAEPSERPVPATIFKSDAERDAYIKEVYERTQREQEG